MLQRSHSCYFDHTFSDEKVENWDKRLSTVFNRGFWDGYYLGQRLGEWSHNYGSLATKRKNNIGKGMNYFENLKVAEFKLESGSLKVGDEIYITGPTTGLIQTTVTEIRVDLQPVGEAQKGVRFSMPLDTKIRRSDKLFKVVDASQVRKQ
jgi:putative protease